VDQSPSRKWSYRLCLALYGESAIILIIALYLATAPAYSHATLPAALISEIIFAVLGSVGLFLSARSFRNGTLLGRGPALLANGIAVGVSYFMDKGKFWLAGIPLGVYASSVLILIILAGRESSVLS
jgi:hypothetical protein